MPRPSTLLRAPVWAPVLTALILFTGCPGPDDTPIPNGSDAGVPVDAGNTATDAGNHDDAGQPDAGGGMDACVPLTCDTAGLICGLAPDGCGGQLNCGVCNCTATTFETDCPSRPCEAATACVDNACVYEPVTCNFEVCDACADGSCDGAELRACGTGCPADFCDPSPSMVNGNVVFGNVCVPRAEVQCGTCELGVIACDGSGGWACEGIQIAGVDPALVECNGASPSATVLFVDPAFTGGSHDGSKEAPFLTLDDALTAAAQRGSRAIVIGGDPTFTEPLTMQDGLSIYGGFGGFPLWARNPTHRPLFDIPASALGNGLLVGLTAKNITTPTELSGVEIRTAHLAGSANGAGAINAGVHLVHAPGLVLRDVIVTVGNGQGGGAGSKGPAVLQSLVPADVGANATQTSGTCANDAPRPGGAGGFAICDNVDSANSSGGDGATTPVPVTSADTGYVKGGNAPTGAQGGLASASNGTFVPGTGENGQAWSAPAMTGASGTAAVTWSGDVPVAEGLGAVGTEGAPGRGGGGGGSGTRQEVTIGSSACRIGGGGGGGGAGGCGGHPGTGGFPGGWSVGVIAVDTQGATFQDVTLSVGSGGAGGMGGAGSNGGPGGPGGNGGSSNGLSIFYVGSSGGHGGAGQQGGTGGDGATGLSVGVLCGNGAAIDLTDVNAMGPGSGFVTTQGCP